MSKNERNVGNEGNLENILTKTISDFRLGNDQDGFDRLVDGINETRTELAGSMERHGPMPPLGRLYGLLLSLYSRMDNDDIVGLTDELEFHFYPFVKTWLGKEDENGAGKGE